MSRKKRRVTCECGHRSYLNKSDARVVMGYLAVGAGELNLSIFRCKFGNIHVGHTPRHVREKYKL